MFASCLIVANLLHHNQAGTSCTSEDGSLVETNYGCIRGTIQDNGRSFTSIPYATPPTVENDLRFRNPIPPDTWSDTLDATTIPPACMQPDCDPPGITCYKTIEATKSEDCLYLNIYTPPYETDTDSLLPVMFYIHGGTYMRQWSGSPLYNPQTMAYLNDVIVVTINYRLGSFGFFYDASNGFDGNYGYFDQQQALKFTYENIEYFGGDKSKIVLFGESAGASSVATLLMDEDNEMYSGAIMISPPLGLPFRTVRSWQNLPSKYVESAGCHNASDVETCMRNDVSSETLLNAQIEASSDITAFCKFFNCYWIFSFMPWTPTLYSDAIPQRQPLQAFKDGEYNKVPIIIGNNDDEGVSFVYDLVAGIYNGSYEHGLCRSQYKALIYAIFGQDYGDRIIQNYRVQEPVGEGCDYRALLARITGELLFICPGRNSSISISKYSKNWKYHYDYLYRFDPPELYFGDNVYCDGVDDNICHGVGLPILFQTEALDFNEDDIRLSNTIQTYFTNLARDEQPSVSNKWRRFREITEWNMVFTQDGEDEMEMRVEEDRGFDCEFWDELGYPQLWWQDSPFPSGDLLRIFGNQTFRDQLSSGEECNNECSDDDTENEYSDAGVGDSGYSEHVVEYRGLGGMTFVGGEDGLLGDHNSLILLTVMALLMLFNTVMILKFQFCGIKRREQRETEKNETSDESDSSEEEEEDDATDTDNQL